MERAAVAFPELRKKRRRVIGSFHSAALVLGAGQLSASVFIFIGSRWVDEQNDEKNFFFKKKVPNWQKSSMPICSELHNLVYTIAFDPPSSPGHRMMAKMLVSSLLKTYFSGDILVFRNSPEPLFRIERKGVEEVYIEAPQEAGITGAEAAWCWKYRVRDWIDASRYAKILYVDADCLALRNLDHLLDGEWDIAYQVERGLNVTLPQFSAFLTDEEMEVLDRSGINSGHLAIRGALFQEVMEEWQRLDTGPVLQARGCLDQASWNRLVLNAEKNRAIAHSKNSAQVTKDARGGHLRTHQFERGEIQFPMYLNPQFTEYKEAALVHCLGGNTREKLQFMFGLYMSTFYHDDSSILLNILEI